MRPNVGDEALELTADPPVYLYRNKDQLQGTLSRYPERNEIPLPVPIVLSARTPVALADQARDRVQTSPPCIEALVARSAAGGFRRGEVSAGFLLFLPVCERQRPRNEPTLPLAAAVIASCIGPRLSGGHSSGQAE